LKTRPTLRFSSRNTTDPRICISGLRGGGDQHLGRRLPLPKFLLGVGKLQDVIGGVLWRHKLAPARQVDWIIEGTTRRGMVSRHPPCAAQ
jgi:hypothetical protein